MNTDDQMASLLLNHLDVSTQAAESATIDTFPMSSVLIMAVVILLCWWWSCRRNQNSLATVRTDYRGRDNRRLVLKVSWRRWLAEKWRWLTVNVFRPLLNI